MVLSDSFRFLAGAVVPYITNNRRHENLFARCHDGIFIGRAGHCP